MQKSVLCLVLCILACRASSALFCTKMPDLQQACRIYSEFTVKELPNEPQQHLKTLENEAGALQSSGQCPSPSMFCFTVIFQYYIRMLQHGDSIINNVNMENTVSLNTPAMQNIQLCDANKQTLCGSECFQNFACPNAFLNFSRFPYDAHLYTCLNNSFISLLDQDECNVRYPPPSEHSMTLLHTPYQNLG